MIILEYRKFYQNSNLLLHLRPALLKDIKLSIIVSLLITPFFIPLANRLYSPET